VAAGVTTPDTDRLREAITSSPNLFPLERTPAGDAIAFVAIDEPAYLAASFLDRRLLAPTSRTGVVPRQLLRPWVAGLPASCDFIFHVSHCGSTLLSRLLGSHPGVFAVREPGILRQAAADAADDGLLDDTLPLLARTFRSDQRAMIKATSVVNRIALPLMQRAGDARGLLMTLPADTFLAAVLDGSPGDIAAHAADRLARLERLGMPPRPDLATLGAGQAAAMSWLCENLSLAAVARGCPGRTAWLDFDHFLAAPAAGLDAALAAFDLRGDANEMLRGDLMQRYAKRPDVAYDAAFRGRLLADARGRFAAEIEAGLAWLDDVGAADRLTGTPVRIRTGDVH
jgi:hypothetical protein